MKMISKRALLQRCLQIMEIIPSSEKGKTNFSRNKDGDICSMCVHPRLYSKARKSQQPQARLLGNMIWVLMVPRGQFSKLLVTPSSDLFRSITIRLKFQSLICRSN